MFKKESVNNVTTDDSNEKASDAMRDWTGTGSDSKIWKESGIITPIIGTSLLGSTLIRESFKFFYG